MRRRIGGTLDEAPLLYTVEDAAALLSIGRTAVFRLIKAGDLRSVQIGKVRRVSADALREYVAALEAGVTA